jgi:hypothetical protein
MWWKLSGVGVLTAALIYAVFFMPITTTAIKLDMPPGTAAASAQHINGIALTAGWAIAALVVVAVFLIPIWIVRRIWRNRRSSH